MNCSNCNAWVPDDSAFCPECGQKVEAPAPANQVNCPNCGAAMTYGDSFCENCGVKVEYEAPAESAGKKFDLKSIPQKYLKLGIAAVAVILVIAILASLFSGGSKVHNYALYLKDGELQYAEMPKGKDVVEVTSKLSDEVSDYYLANAAYYLGQYIHMSEDGKKLFYPDKIDDGYTLYYRLINNPKKEPVKLESGLEDGYSVNTKGNLVTYVKDGKLYQHNLKEKTKIASDVTTYRVSEDGKTLLYLVWEDGDDAGTLYLKKGSKDATKLASDVSSIKYVSEDFKTIMFVKNDSMYLKNGNKDVVKIAADVRRVLNVYEDGSFYYTQTSEEEITYWDLVNDDYETPDDWYYDSYKEWMQEETVDMDLQVLCYYNGKESTTINENVMTIYGYSSEAPVMVYSALEGNELPSFSLTAYINGEISIYDELAHYMDTEGSFSIVSEGTVGALDLQDICNVQLSDDGKTLYVCTDYEEEDNIAKLSKLTLNGVKVKKTEKLDEDVCASQYYIVDYDSVVYYKEVDGSEGELYMDGKKVDDDVYLYNTSFNAETGNLYYIVDWDTEHDMGTLKYSNGKKSTTVKDDVSIYYFTPEGEVLFLYDYDEYRGELWIQNGKKVEKLDDDVVGIVPVY